ncbi:unnamed protein product, partial [Prorocentrum cordatum]
MPPKRMRKSRKPVKKSNMKSSRRVMMGIQRQSVLWATKRDVQLPPRGSRPQTPVDVQWPLGHLVGCLTVAEKATITDFLKAGVSVITDYSGCGQAERAIDDIAYILGLSPENCVVNERSCDIQAHCRDLLRGLRGQGCIQTDMRLRMPGVVREALEKLIARYSKEMQEKKSQSRSPDQIFTKKQMGQEFVKEAADIMKQHMGLYKSDVRVPCERHRHAGRGCLAYPQKGDDKKYRLLVAGMSCLDWSAKGSKIGVFGVGAMAWCTLMWDMLNDPPDVRSRVGILECTLTYDEEHIRLALQSVGATVDSAVFSPHMLGVPCQRFRKYMVVLFGDQPSRPKWSDPSATFSKKNLLGTFGRICHLSGSEYMKDTSKAETREMTEKLAIRNHMPIRTADGKRWAMVDVLGKGVIQRYQQHK